MVAVRDSRISSERMTCTACPEQWEGELRGGLNFYFRYRHGHVTLGIGGTVSEAITAASQEDGWTGAGRSHGDGLQGVFDSEEDRDEVFTSMLDGLLARWQEAFDRVGARR